jgi:TonB-dependent SusC/RagA subfamily outer membrane receptor
MSDSLHPGMSRLTLALLALAVSACSASRFSHPSVVPSSDERVALGFPRDVLYVLDGRILPRGDSATVPSAVRELDPARIERIEVLKGATAKRAYGDAGSSGVVIITTKASR